MKQSIKSAAKIKRCKAWWISVLLCLSMMLGGCSFTEGGESKQSSGEGASAAVEEAGEQEVYAETREPVNFFAQEWKPADERQTTKVWWQSVDYKKDLIQNPEGSEKCDRTFYAAEGTDCYILAGYGRASYLNHIDGNTLETDCKKLIVEGLEADSGTYFPVGLEVVSGIPISFIQQWDDETQETIHYYIGQVHEDGTVRLSVDILPAMKKAGIRIEDNYIFSDVKADARGYYYVYTDKAQVAVIDEEGALLHIMEAPGGSEGSITGSYKTYEGVRVFEFSSLQDTSSTTFYYNGKETEVLCKGSYECVSVRCTNPYGEIYYFSSEGNLVCWDMTTGMFASIYMGTGVEILSTAKVILYNDAGDVLVLCDEGTSQYVSVLSRNGLKDKIKITVAAVGFADYYFRCYASAFSRENPNVVMEVKAVSDDEWIRTMADLSAGKGPDILLLDREKLIALQEKGILADLSDVLPKEVKEQIFEGVLQQGSVDGRLYSIIYCAGPDTLMVSSQVWDKATWTIEEVLQIIEKREKEGKPIINFVAEQYESTPDSMLWSFMKDLEHSSFLDLKSGECYFDTEEFKALLKVCKKYGVVSAKKSSSNLDSVVEDNRKKMQNGEALAYKSMLLDLFWMGEDMAALGEEYTCVGYPTEGESGSYWNCYNGIAVNAKTENRELIDEFLCYVMNEENQREAGGYMVRKDVIRDNVVWQDWNKSYGFYIGNRSYRSLETKNDGSTYVEDYIALLESCVAKPTEADAIRAIIDEEIPAYFNGDKDVDTVADIIQSRASLYLKERK